MKPMKPLEPITKGLEATQNWWPNELGTPGVTGSSNRLRYAYFASKHRLAVNDGQHVKIYDTEGQAVGGFSSSDGKTLTFDVDGQSRELSSLKLV